MDMKPCPFCGAKAVLSKLENPYNESYSISCMGDIDGGCAGLEGSPFYDTAEEAILQWNTRNTPAEIQRLQDQIEDMKCCWNCEEFKHQPQIQFAVITHPPCLACENFCNWKLKT